MLYVLPVNESSYAKRSIVARANTTTDDPLSSIIRPFERIARRDEIVAVTVAVLIVFVVVVVVVETGIRSVADRFLGITFFVLDELCATFYLSCLG